MDVVFICSMAHSGSTFLELLLSRHEEMIGLGELGHSLEYFCRDDSYFSDPDRELEVCTCGQLIEDCNFWGTLHEKLGEVTTSEGHDEVLDQFENLYGSKILVDATKDTKYIRRHYERIGNGPIDNFKVIFLFRDFRGWVESCQNDPDRYKNLLHASYKWMRRNFKKRWELNSYDFSTYELSYENLVFSYEEEMESLLNFLGVEKTVPDVSEPFENHNIMGNEMRLDSEKRQKIIYDHGWIQNSQYWIYQPFLIPVYAYNQYLYNRVNQA